MRDIWPYYSAVILCYSILYYLRDKSLKIPIIGGIFIALFQFMRPPTFMLILTSSFFLILYAIFSKKFLPVIKLLLTIAITNILFFWLPFMTYNKIAYDRYIVGPTGINLIQGLGEFPNKWGYKLSDGWFANYMNTNHKNLNNIERDDKARELFFKAIKEDPQYYLSCLFRRIPRLILPGLPSFNYQDTKEIYLLYVTGTPVKELVNMVVREPIILIDFIARHIYIGLFLFFAYLGMLLALIRRRFFELFFIYIGVISASYTVIFAHTDHRYLIPYYAFFAIFVGYFFAQTIGWIKNK
jgi:hypothetical protein